MTTIWQYQKRLQKRELGLPSLAKASPANREVIPYAIYVRIIGDFYSLLALGSSFEFLPAAAAWTWIEFPAIARGNISDSSYAEVTLIKLPATLLWMPRRRHKKPN